VYNFAADHSLRYLPSFIRKKPTANTIKLKKKPVIREEAPAFKSKEL